MSIFDGTYKSLLEGVSQQTPQERRDGQLSEQINMLSDKVTGLRRRGGVLLDSIIEQDPKCYFRIVTLGGEPYIVAINPELGTLYVQHFRNPTAPLIKTFTHDYFKAAGRASFRTTTSRDNFFIVNTDRTPTKVDSGVAGKNPADFGYFSIRGSQFSKSFTIDVSHPSLPNGLVSKTVTASANTAAQATPEHIANELFKAFNGDSGFNSKVTSTLSGVTISFELKTKGDTDAYLDVQSSSTSGGYVMVSGASRVPARSELLGVLPVALDGYIMAVGNTGNSVYYKYSDKTKKWSEVAAYEKPYKIVDEPLYLYIDAAGQYVLKPLGIQPRMAGDADNNPDPSFLEFGITGIGAYQSRLVLLSGAYVHLSKTNTFNQFMRTSVAELLDDDAIEVSSASLSSAQFEYCIPYNKDLVLISQNQQAVMPANNTVLTPKSAVIYPSTDLDLSMAAEPVSVGRTMYYSYQRGVDYYQIGEFIPNTYADAQYYSQNLTDHIPLYATGVCTNMAASSTNNMCVFSSDAKELLVNQYMWAGEERAQMAFHKWEYPYPVRHGQFLNEYLITFMDLGGGKTLIGTQNVQLNQLRTKPVPYLDVYSYVDIVDGVGNLPNLLYNNMDEVKGVIYDSINRRHKEVFIQIKENKVHCPYSGRIAIGIPYKSGFTLTPPFMKDDNDKVIAGARSTVQSLRMTFENTGRFNIKVQDTMGVSYDRGGNTATTWSEADLGYSWVNSIGSVVIPCRTQLSSTECSVFTTGTTDMNVVSVEYTLRVATKRRRV